MSGCSVVQEGHQLHHLLNDVLFLSMTDQSPCTLLNFVEYSNMSEPPAVHACLASQCESMLLRSPCQCLSSVAGTKG